MWNGKAINTRPRSPTSPSAIARSFMGAGSTPSRSPRALLLTVAALIALLLFYQTHASIRASDEYGSFKALLTTKSSYVKISEAPPNASGTEERGMLLLLSSNTTESELERVTCDILKIRSDASEKSDARHAPVAYRHLSIAIEDSQDPSLLSFTHVEERLKGMLASGKCSGGDTLQRSLSLRKVNERSVITIIDALRPLAVLHVKNARLQGAVEAAVKKTAGATTSIVMPQEDLEHSGWIFSLPEKALKAWHVPKFKNILITNDRSTSLRRLYRSLQHAHYFGDGLDLSIKVEASADDETIKAITDMTSAKSPDSWKLGRSDVFFRFRQAGLICNIVEAWYPTGNDEYAFFFEDDIEASPFFYAWSKWAILMYRYGPDAPTEPAKNIYGISLIQQMTSELDRATGRIMWSAEQELRKTEDFDNNSPYLSQVPSSWGAVYFPEHWREFHDYIQVRDGEEIVPTNTHMVAPWLVSDQWGGSWKRFLIELAFLRGYSMLYPNYPEWASLSTNHVELGEHIDPKKQAQLRKMQEVPLMQDNQLLDVPQRRLAPIAKVPVFDLWGKITDAETLVTRGVNRHKDLWNCTTTRPRSSDFNSFALFACL